MALEVCNSPTSPEFTLTDKSSLATKWADWFEGLETMVSAMKFTDDNHKYSLLLHLMRNNSRKLLKAENTGTENENKPVIKAITYFAQKT